jgi:hypothetical protein
MLEFYLKKEQTASVERAIPYGIASLARAFLPLGDVRFFDASGLFADRLLLQFLHHTHRSGVVTYCQLSHLFPHSFLKF